MKKIAALIIAAFIALNVSQALAVETYSDEQKKEFTNWCSGSKSFNEPVCNCALKNIMQTVAPATLTSYLANDGKFSLSTTSAMTATAVTSAFAICGK